MPRDDHQQQSEIILAQHQSVVYKTGLGEEIQGTLILTNKKLIFVAANQEQDLVVSQLPREIVRLRFADVDDLREIRPDPSNLSIPLEKLEVVKGREGIVGRPRLRIKWESESGQEKSVEFIEDIIEGGRKKKDLKDWARVVEKLKSGDLLIQYPKSPPPGKDTLEGKILHILGDMQEKGLFEIERAVEEKFGINLDPDEVEAACKRLASQGFLDAMSDPSGDNFYRKKSPLGQDDLSS